MFGACAGPAPRWVACIAPISFRDGTHKICVKYMEHGLTRFINEQWNQIPQSRGGTDVKTDPVQIGDNFNYPRHFLQLLALWNIKARNLLLWPPLPWGHGGQEDLLKGIKKDFSLFLPPLSLSGQVGMVSLYSLTSHLLGSLCASDVTPRSVLTVRALGV